MFYAAEANYLTWLLRSSLARAPYVALFDLKLLIEDDSLQVYMYCVHAQKRALGTPRTHFRACKISKFRGGMPPDPPHIIHFFWAPLFLFALAPPNPLGSPDQELTMLDVFLAVIFTNVMRGI